MKRSLAVCAASVLFVLFLLFPLIHCGGNDSDDNDQPEDDDIGDDDAGDDDDTNGEYNCFNPPTEPPADSYLPLGVWYHWIGATGDEQHDREHYGSSFADLSAHGIDLIIANFVFGEDRVWLLEEADKQGLKVIMAVPEMTALIIQPIPISQSYADGLAEELAAPLRDMPALFGYYIADEPGIHNIIPENLTIARQAFEKADPEHPSYCIFALLDRMWTYFNALRPEVLLTDMYPLYRIITTPEMFVDGWHIDNFIDHLQTAGEIAGATPTWLVAQAFSNNLQWRMPIFEEIRAMVYLALNRGVSGIVYFCYQSIPLGEQLQGLLDLNEQPTLNYERLAEFHLEFEPIKTALLWSQPTSTIAQTVEPFDLASFRHQMGHHYITVVNRDVLAMRTATIEIPVSNLPNIEAIFDEETGDLLPFEDAGGIVRFSWTLDPGDGRMFRICTAMDH